MAKFTLTKKAVADLADIWNYTCDTWSEQQADKYYALLLDFCQDLANKPYSGKKYDEVLPTLLGRKIGQHILFYRVLGAKEIEVVRILHGRMDMKRRMQ